MVKIGFSLFFGSKYFANGFRNRLFNFHERFIARPTAVVGVRQQIVSRSD